MVLLATHGWKNVNLRRCVSWVPWSGFGLLFGTSVALLWFISPALQRLDPVLAQRQGVIEAGPFAASSLVWAGLGVGVIASLVVVYAVSMVVITEVSAAFKQHRGRVRRASLCAIPIVTVAGSIVSLFTPQSDLTRLRDAQGVSLFRFGMEWLTALANGMTLGAIAALFAASYLVMRVALILPTRNKGVARDGFEMLHHRMQVLLWVGAVATVFGTIEIAAIHRLAGESLAVPTEPAIKVIGDVALSMSSFWGMAFTLALGALYLPTSVVIQLRTPAPPKPARGAGVPGFIPDPPGWGARLKAAFAPFLGLLAALAPLLVGQLSDIILKMTSNQ